MPDLTVAMVASALSEVANRDTGVSLEDRLRELGWVELPSSRAPFREWRNGEITVDHVPVEPDLLEMTMDSMSPDPDDPDDEARILTELESTFDRRVSQCVPVLGGPSYVGRYRDENYPDDVDAVMMAQWRFKAGTFAINLVYDDSGLPLRITVTVH